MSNQTWPSYATRQSDSKKISALDAKNSGDTFTIAGTIVTPAVGAKNVPHWRSLNGSSYARPTGMQAREMSPWHRGMINKAIENGLEDEYRVPNSVPLMIADAYDASTNTVYEYVWSHDDPAKVSAYFDLGYNQIWVFALERKSKWEFRHYSVNSLDVSKAVELAGFNLPSVGAHYE